MIVWVTDILKTYAEVINRVKAKRIISHLHVVLILLDVKHVNNKNYFIAVRFLYSTAVKFEHGLSLTILTFPHFETNEYKRLRVKLYNIYATYSGNRILWVDDADKQNSSRRIFYLYIEVSVRNK